MKKLRTPNIKEMRDKTGTFYSFTSAVEDIGLNISERHNKVRISHYAILDIPDTEINYLPEPMDVSKISIANKFNFPSQIGNLVYDVSGKVNRYPATVAIAQSFQNYALNLETNLLRSQNYNAVSNLTVSERTFWKWLKESGAIRMTKEGPIIKEEPESINGVNTGYNRVVKAIGEINTGSYNIDNWGSSTEIYVQLPSSYGTTPVYFKEVEDNNYHYGMKLSNGGELIVGNTEDMHNNMSNYAFMDIMTGLGVDGTVNSDIKVKKLVNGNVIPGSWYGETSSEQYMYIMDNSKFSEIADPTQYNDTIINEVYTNGVKESSSYLIRSKADCLCVDFDVNHYNTTAINLEELAIATEAKDYSFNAVLIYYTIYDNSGETALSTNLLGVLFVQSPIGVIESGAPNGVFTIPSLEKLKSSSGNGYGTSFNFRLNIQSNNLSDDTAAVVIDQTSSLSYLDDFGNVFANLNRSIKLMNQHAVMLNKISEDNEKKINEIIFLKKENKRIINAINNITGNTYNYNVLFNNTVITAGTNILSAIKTADRSIHIGSNSGYNMETSSQNVMIGHESGYNNKGGVGNVYIGYRAGYSETGNNKLIIGNDEHSNLIYGDFSAKTLEFNITSLKLNPDMYKQSGSGIGLCINSNGEVIRSTSSMRYKYDIREMDHSKSESIYKINPVIFKYKGESVDTVGFIAEELHKIDENLTICDSENRPDAIRQDTIITYLVSEVQKLRSEINKLKK